ncbi:MAG: hypothetical protein P8R42_12185 [Candidatus Binatia bacterium]|nr:hypothetical protein [Candidatus Binatia bacterium]
MTTIRNRHSSRAVHTAARIRTPSLRRIRTRGASDASTGSLAKPRRRPTVRRLPPLTSHGGRPLLRVVASNPHFAKKSAHTPRRRHLTLVGAAVLPTGLLQTTGEPWTHAEPKSHTMIVLGLAAAGLVALATAIGRLLTTSL